MVTEKAFSRRVSRRPVDRSFVPALMWSGDARLQENALAKTQQSEAETPRIFIVDFFNQQIQWLKNQQRAGTAFAAVMENAK